MEDLISGLKKKGASRHGEANCVTLNLLSMDSVEILCCSRVCNMKNGKSFPDPTQGLYFQGECGSFWKLGKGQLLEFHGCYEKITRFIINGSLIILCFDQVMHQHSIQHVQNTSRFASLFSFLNVPKKKKMLFLQLPKQANMTRRNRQEMGKPTQKCRRLS